MAGGTGRGGYHFRVPGILDGAGSIEETEDLEVLDLRQYSSMAIMMYIL